MITWLFGRFRPVLVLFLTSLEERKKKKKNWPLLDLSASPQVKISDLDHLRGVCIDLV